MGQFVGDFAVSPLADGKTWYLRFSFAYTTNAGTTIQVPAGFETDFASVPQVLQNVLRPWDTYGEAAVIHDWLYWNQQTDRKTADDVLLEAMESSNVPAWKERCIYLAVRAFGEFAWESNAAIGAQGYSRVRTDQSPPVPLWSRE